MIKYGSSKIVGVSSSPDEILRRVASENPAPDWFVQRLRSKLAAFDPVRLNPGQFLYLRNRAISGEESWGPNQNWDGFPSNEVRAGYPTFPGAVLDIDHDPSLPIGSVIDSFYLPKAIFTPTAKQLRAFSSYGDLQLGEQVVGDWIENVWAIDKQSIEAFYPRSVEAIRDGEITDTSMGCEINYSKCSICDHQAAEPGSFCEHIGAFGVNKGMQFPHPVTGMKIASYERCFGLRFFEDSLILPEQFNGSPGSQGADVSAKILQIFARMGGRSEAETKRFAGYLRLLCNRLPEDQRQEFIKLISSIK